MDQEELVDQLIPNIDRKIAERIVKYYFDAKSAFFKRDPEIAQLKTGKFLEQVGRALKFLETNQVINDKIELDTIVTELERTPKGLGEEIRIIIPRLIRGGYTFRNRRSVAHSSDVDPTLIDAKICIDIMDWTLSELLRLFHNYTEEKIEKIIRMIIRKQIPIGQTIGETTIPFDETLNLSDSFLVILYVKLKPTARRELYDYNIKYHQVKEDAITILNNLELSRKILGDNNNDYEITDKGIKYVEEELVDKILLKINS